MNCISGRIRVAHDPMRDVLHDDHASTTHVMHRLGKCGPRSYCKSEREIEEIAFARLTKMCYIQNKRTAFSEMTLCFVPLYQCMVGLATIIWSTWASHIMEDSYSIVRIKNCLFPPSGDLNLGHGLFMGPEPHTGSSWRSCQKFMISHLQYIFGIGFKF